MVKENSKVNAAQRNNKFEKEATGCTLQLIENSFVIKVKNYFIGRTSIVPSNWQGAPYQRKL